MAHVKVYVAGSSKEIQRCSAAMTLLRASGIEVTSTWIESIARAGGVANPANAHRTDRCAWSLECLEAVDAADVVWLLAPADDAPTRGAWGELCYAHARAKTIIASGNTHQSIFCALALVEYYEDSEALSLLVRMATMGDV